MYNNIFHTNTLTNKKFLITGGAGFIGSNIVEYLMKNNAGFVRVLDNLSTGHKSNIEKYIGLQNFEFVEGDIRNYESCLSALETIDYVFHQAALGSVPRSVADPITTNQVNIDGFLNILVAIKENKNVKRIVYAASSSTYGDHEALPKIEERIGNPLSPYAVTKYVNELYAQVFANTYKIETIGLRYFNVFGPKQNPNNPYAAVIPIFCKHFIDGTMPTIFGDGETSRDFTFVENAVQANIKSLLVNELSLHEVMNVACGDQFSLNKMIFMLNEISGQEISANYGPERTGDVRHSKADIQKIKKMINFDPNINFNEGLKITYSWYLQESNY